MRARRRRNDSDMTAIVATFVAAMLILQASRRHKPTQVQPEVSPVVSR